MPILEELCNTYEVHVFTCDFNKNLPERESYHGMTICRFRLRTKELVVSKIFGVFDKGVRDINPPLIPLKRVVWRTLHALFDRPALERLLTEYPVRKSLVRQLNSDTYKAFLTLSAPIEPQRDALALAQAGLLNHIPWFAYFADPHATFIGLADRYERLMEKEIEIYQMADAVFTTPELYEDNQRYPLGQFRDKTIPVAFVNLRPLTRSSRPDYLAEGKINCVYAGSLFSTQVRNPEYFYRIAQACDERFQFHIVCNCMDGTNRDLKRQYVDNNPNFHWHDCATLSECLNLMCWANVLINLGNRCTNQMPSKIFDYISAGRAIVNVHPLENDTAKRYLDRYPLTLNILEHEALDPEDVQQFVDFCVEHREDSVAFESVRERFADCTPKAVADAFRNQIEQNWQPHVRA